MNYHTCYLTLMIKTVRFFWTKFTITKIFILIRYSWLVWYICYKTSFVLIDAQIITSITLYVNIANKCMHIITKMQTWSFIFIPHIFDCLLISQSIISIKAVVDHSRCRCIRCCNVRYRYNSNDNIVVYCFLSNFV